MSSTTPGRQGRWNSCANTVGPCWVLDDPGGEPLSRLLGAPMEFGRFLRLALGIATALGKAHQRALVHKDIKPANIFVNTASGNVRLTGFGIASRLPRERQALARPKPSPARWPIWRPNRRDA